MHNVKQKYLINPFFMITILLFINLFMHLALPNLFGDIRLEVFLIVILYLFSFGIGFYIFGSLFLNTIKKNIKYHTTNFTSLELIPHWKYIYYIFIIFLSYSLFNEVLLNGISTIAEYRININNHFNNKGNLYWIMRGFSLVFFIALIQFIYVNSFKMRFYWAFISLASAIIGSGRNYLLFFFLTLLIIVLQGKNVLIKLVIMVISFFLVSIFFIFAFNKADPDSGIILGTLLSLSHYFSVPLYGLSVIMDNNNLGTFMLLSDGILNILNISHIPTPPMEYTPYPFITNVYTLFWPMYYDLGYLGIIVFGLFYGFIHMILYSMAKNGGVAFYLYCISLYPLFMSIFHDTYLSSIGLWVVASVALIFFRKKENINV